MKIAIQKNGRLTSNIIELLKNIGYEFDPIKNKLLVKVRNADIELLLLRDDDIPEYVQDGIADAGIVGLNIVKEKSAQVKILCDLPFGCCDLAIAVPKKSRINTVSQLKNMNIATSYPNILRKFLNKNKIPANIIELSGSVEIAPSLNIANAICDLVSSGITMRTNGLKVLKNIFSSSATLIRTKNRLPSNKESIMNNLLLRIKSYLIACKNRYIMMNAPKAKLNQICEMLPALSSPTIMPLADGKMLAIHTVIPQKDMYEVMDKVKKKGASGILIVPIQSLII